MTMTRQHFALIAEGIAKLGTEYGPLPTEDGVITPRQRESIARYFVGVLRQTNPSFNPSRFLKACGVER